MNDRPPNPRGTGTWLLVLAALVVGILVAPLLPVDWLPFRGSGSHPSPSDAASAPAAQLWTCAMHPHVLEEEPGQCPICGMNLTPLAGSSEDDGDSAGLDGPRGESNERASVRIDPRIVQNMNLRTARVERRDLTRPIRTVGYLDYDPAGMVTVTTKYPGWIEKVYVNYVGERVRRGQPLFEIYSPELVQTEQELLSALRFAAEMQEAPADARQRVESMVAAARTRLGYWDVSEAQIAELERTGRVFRTLEVAAPANGLVMKRLDGLEGMAVRPGMELFHIADLSRLWLSVELSEDQVAWVTEGTGATFTLTAFPGETFDGHVRLVEPELSEETRTVRAWIEVPNPDRRLRKGMYAVAELQPLRRSDAVVVPTSAVLRTGRRDLLVVVDSNGRFTPRDVVTGDAMEGWTEIRNGVAVGEEVVTSAQFLLDSESSLREAVRRLTGSGSPPETQGSHAGHGVQP